MKTMNLHPQKPFSLGAALAANILVSVSAAHADTYYASSATIGLAVLSVTGSNPDDPNDVTGLTISTAFGLPTDAGSSYAYESGDGTYQVHSPAMDPFIPADRRFDATFAVGGQTPLQGTVDTLHTGEFHFGFSNGSPYTYRVSVALDYSLHAATSGLYANSAVFLDYWDTGETNSGSDYLGAGTYDGYTDDDQNKPGSAIWDFTLLPGASNRITARVAIQSSLESSAAAPVPLPAALWLFAGALAGVVGLMKPKRA